MDSESRRGLGTQLHVFVSHSSHDNEFGKRLERKLKAEPAITSIWYDSDGGLIGGDLWQDRIEQELMARNILVVILSPKALDSPWVRHEIRTALAIGITGNRVIIPVMHKSADVPPFLRAFQQVDFVKQPYEDAYQDLVNAITLGVSRMHEIAVGFQEFTDYLPPFDLSELNPPERFVGREADLVWILRRLLAPRPGQSQMANIVAASGMGGIGKTALAGEVLRRLYENGQFRDGMAVVVCKDLRDPSIVLRRILSRFAPNGKTPEDSSFDLLTSKARAQLTGRDALVVLDNIEPGWPVEQVIAPLRQAGVALLLTMRETILPASLPPEASHRLELLSSEEAVDLFLSCYGATTQRLTSYETVQSIERIIRALGRHTLAVRLAALHAAAEERDLGAYAAELEHNPYLVNGASAVTTILESSYRALSYPSQRLFVGIAMYAQQEMGRLAVHALGRAIDVEEVESSLFNLIHMGLVDSFQNTTMPISSDRERLRLHPLVVQYAREVAISERYAGEGIDLHLHHMIYTRMTQYYIDYIRRLTPRNPSERDSTLYAAIDVDEATMETVLERSRGIIDDESQIKLTEALIRYWRDRWRIEEALKYLPIGIQAATRQASGIPDRERQRRLAQLKLAYAKMLVRSSRWDDAWYELKQNLVMRQAISDKEGEGIVLSRMGELALAQGRAEGKADSLDIAARYLNTSISIHGEVRNWQGEAIDLQLLATIAERRGDLLGAETWLERALAVYRGHGNTQGEGVILAKLGENAISRGDMFSGESYYRAGIHALRKAEDAVSFAEAALEFGKHLVLNETKQEGCTLIQEAIAMMRARRLPGVAAALALAAQLGCPRAKGVL